MKILWLLALISLVSFSTFAQSASAMSESDVAALLEDAIRNGKGARIFISEYTHTQTIINRSLDKKGNLKEISDTWEAFMPTQKFRRKPSRWVRVKIKENGVPLPEDKIAKARIEGGEALLKAEQEAEKLAAKGVQEKVDENTVPNAKGAYFNLSLRRMFRGEIELNVRTILENCAFGNPRREIFLGRPAVILDFKPKANVKWPDATDYLANLAGTVWIDEADRILVKAEGWPQSLGARLEKPAIYYEGVLASGGKWLPHRIRLNGLTHKKFFSGFNEEIEAVLTDYQRYDSEVKDEKILAPKPPE